MSLAALLLASLAAAPTLRVDRAAPPGGDGSAERPFARLTEALAAAPAEARIELAAGLYEEAVVVSRAVTVEGVGDRVVLAAPPGSATAVSAEAPLTLVHLTVQGGRTGVAAHRGVSLTDVALRGQPDVAIDCSHADCTLTRVALEASFSSAVGIRLGSSARIDGVALDGPFKRGLDVLPGAQVRGEEVTLRGATTGVQAERPAAVELRRLVVEDARQVAVFVSGGALRLTEPVLARSGYGILARDEARVAVRGAVLEACADADLASVGSTVEVDDWVSSGRTRDAAMTFDGGRARVTHALVMRPGPVGIRVHAASVELAHVTVVGAIAEGTSFGNALFLQDAQAQVRNLEAEHLAGPAVEAQLGDASIHGLTVIDAPAAIDWEFQAHLDVAGLLQHGGTGTGLACIEGGRGTVRAARFEGLAASPWLIDCSCRLQIQPRPAELPTCPGEAVSRPAQRTIPGLHP